MGSSGCVDPPRGERALNASFDKRRGKGGTDTLDYAFIVQVANINSSVYLYFMAQLLLLLLLLMASSIRALSR